MLPLCLGCNTSYASGRGDGDSGRSYGWRMGGVSNERLPTCPTNAYLINFISPSYNYKRRETTKIKSNVKSNWIDNLCDSGNFCGVFCGFQFYCQVFSTIVFHQFKSALTWSCLRCICWAFLYLYILIPITYHVPHCLPDERCVRNDTLAVGWWRTERSIIDFIDLTSLSDTTQTQTLYRCRRRSFRSLHQFRRSSPLVAVCQRKQFSRNTHWAM